MLPDRALTTLWNALSYLLLKPIGETQLTKAGGKTLPILETPGDEPRFVPCLFFNGAA